MRALVVLILVPFLLGNAQVSRKRKHVYSPALAGNIVGSCSKRGISPEICFCFLDRLEQTFSEKEYEHMAALATAGRPMPRAFLRAIEPCTRIK